MSTLLCLACGALGGQGLWSDALDAALANGFAVHAHGPALEVYCSRHAPLCVEHLPAPAETEVLTLVPQARVERVDSAARIARLRTMAAPHIVRSVRAHAGEPGAVEYTRAAVSELARRPGWGLGRATWTLEDVLERLGLLSARAA